MRALLLGLIFVLLASQAKGEAAACVDGFAKMAGYLRAEYQEELVVQTMGVNDKHGPFTMSIFASPEGERTWSLVGFSRKDGRACLLSSGKNWRYFPPRGEGT